MLVSTGDSRPSRLTHTSPPVSPWAASYRIVPVAETANCTLPLVPSGCTLFSMGTGVLRSVAVAGSNRATSTWPSAVPMARNPGAT